MAFSLSLAFILSVSLQTASPAPLGQDASPPSQRASRLAWGDPDGDGRSDALAVLPSGAAALLRYGDDQALFDATNGSGLEGLGEVWDAQWVDFDADGADDLFVIGGRGARLWKSHGGRSFEDVTETIGLGRQGEVVDASWIELDGDGLPDLHLATERGDRLYLNSPGGVFSGVDVRWPAAEGSRGAAAVVAPLAGGERTASEAATDGGPTQPSRAGRASGPAPSALDGAGPLGAGPPLASSASDASPTQGPPSSAGAAAAGAACPPAVADQATTACLMASSVPAFGMLYPLGSELFIDAATANVGVGTTTPGHRLDAYTAVPGGTAVRGSSASTTGGGNGVWGSSASPAGAGVLGEATAASGASYGVLGTSESTGGSGVYGGADASSGFTRGVEGVVASTAGRGVEGRNTSTSGNGVGVRGESTASSGGIGIHGVGSLYGVRGQSLLTAGQAAGVHGESVSTGGIGVEGRASATTGTNYGVYGRTDSGDGYGGYFLGRGYFSGNVGIGVSSPLAKLDVAGTVELDGLRLPTGAQAGHVLKADASGNATWQLDLVGGNIAGSGTVGYLSQFSGTGTIQSSPLYNGSGYLGYGTTSPSAALHVKGGQLVTEGFPGPTLGTSNLWLEGTHLGGGTGAMLHFGAPGNPENYLRDNASSYLEVHGELGTLVGPGNVGIATAAANLTHSLVVESGFDNDALRLIGKGGNFGEGARINFGDADYVKIEEDVDDHLRVRARLGTTINAAGSVPLTLAAESDAVPTLVCATSAGTETVKIYAYENGAANVDLYNGATRTIEIDAQDSNGAGKINLTNAAGNTRLQLDGGDASGWSRIVTDVLEIRGGADVVEGFDTAGPCTPGTVVVIDPEHPGRLVRSSTPYDRKVSGVVSGAGGVAPGLSLAQEGALDGDTLVSLTGRVYVQCSAENGPIAPGDRLTTAAAPGHAMKATDPRRCDGAVLGKAMSSLEGGTGLVLVLVNLQ